MKCHYVLYSFSPCDEFVVETNISQYCRHLLDDGTIQHLVPVDRLDSWKPVMKTESNLRASFLLFLWTSPCMNCILIESNGMIN